MRSWIPAGAAAAAILVATSAFAQARPRLVALNIRALDPKLEKTARALTEVALTELSKARCFQILGEGEIAEVIGFDRQKQMLGCTEESCLQELGGALGSRYLLVGTLGYVGRNMRVDLKILDAKRASALARDGAEVGSADQLTEGVRGAIRGMLDAFPDEMVARTARANLESEDASAAVGEPAEALGNGPIPKVLLVAGGAAALAGGGLTWLALSFNAERESLTYERAALARKDAEIQLAAGGALLAVGAAALVTGAVMLAAAPDEDALVLAPVRGGAVALARFSF